MEDPQLNVAQNEVRNGRKDKTKFKSDIAAIRSLSSVQGDGPNVPYLAHAGHHARNAAAEGPDSSNAWRQALGVIVKLWPVSTHAALEEKVVSEGDAFVDGQPVSYKISVRF